MFTLILYALLSTRVQAAECDAEPIANAALSVRVKASFEKFSRLESPAVLESTWGGLATRPCRRTEEGGHHWIRCMRAFCREQTPGDFIQFSASMNEAGDTSIKYIFSDAQVAKKDVSTLLAALPHFDNKEVRIAIGGEAARPWEEIKVDFNGGWYLARSSPDALTSLERRGRKPQSPRKAWPFVLRAGQKVRVQLPFPIGSLNMDRAGVVDFVRDQRPDARPVLVLSARQAGTAEIKIHDGQGRVREILMVVVAADTPATRPLASTTAPTAAPTTGATASPGVSPCAKGRQIVQGVALFPELFFERTSAMLEAIDGSDPEQEYPLPGTRGDPKRRAFYFENLVHDQTKLFLRVYIGEKAYDSEAIYLDRTKGCTINQTVDQRKWLLKLPRP